MDGAKSSSQAIASGVAQGSVLGPLLFVLYFRDLPSGVKGTCALFADDTLVYDTSCDGSALCCRLQTDLDGVAAWAHDWQNVFNAEKSALMVISRKKIHAREVLLNEVPFSTVSIVKHLGVTISNNLCR